MRRIVYEDRKEDAPEEVFLEFSVTPDGSEPCLEDDYLTRPDHEHQPVRYVREDVVTRIISQIIDKP